MQVIYTKSKIVRADIKSADLVLRTKKCEKAPATVPLISLIPLPSYSSEISLSSYFY
jgi:hypothetical protein